MSFHGLTSSEGGERVESRIHLTFVSSDRRPAVLIRRSASVTSRLLAHELAARLSCHRRRRDSSARSHIFLRQHEPTQVDAAVGRRRHCTIN